MKMILIAVVSVTVIGIIVAAVLISGTHKTGYSTLFTGLSQDEAQQIVGYLQEQNVEFEYDGNSGSIRVPGDSADTLRAQLLSAGYPKSGFTYDIYRNNSGLMTTESDKKQYTLYDLQDRLGSTIRLFDGVRDAKVTIAEGTEQTYAVQDNATIDATASVVVTMQDGKSLSEANASAIKNLVARSVQGMNFTNVSVFDASTMTEVSGNAGDESSGHSMAELTGEVEENIAANIRRVLGKIYGIENVAVSVNGVLNMQKLISENTQYSVPEKVDETDKQGLLSHEELAGDIASDSGENASGVAGADANADTPRYVNQNGDGTTTEVYNNSSATRDWLFNVLKTQTEIDPGVLEDTSVGIVINTSDNSISNQNLINLVADAAGVARDQASNKITIIRSPQIIETTEAASQSASTATIQPAFPLWAVLAAAGALLVLLLLLFILLGRRRRRRKARLEAERAAAEAESRESLDMAAEAEEDKEPEVNEEDAAAAAQANSDVEHGQQLQKSIGEFADQNPQVVARLLQSWLREDEEAGNNGRVKHRTTRK